MDIIILTHKAISTLLFSNPTMAFYSMRFTSAVLLICTLYLIYTYLVYFIAANTVLQSSAKDLQSKASYVNVDSRVYMVLFHVQHLCCFKKTNSTFVLF